MPDEKTIHLISDSTGETLGAMARASLARFGDITPEVRSTIFVRSDADLDSAIAGLRARPGLVFFTLVNPGHRSRLEAVCAEIGVEAVPALDGIVGGLTRFFGVEPERGVGMQHRLNTEYFDRIAALDFAIANDDGALESRFAQADVILVGVSRTSKTPTCIYLAYRGVKAANMPLVPNRAPDPAFFAALDAGVPAIGLIASPTRLSQIRSLRLEALGDRPSDYADLDRIRGEVADARLFFERHTIPVIDITRRSIEETAAEVLAELRAIRRARTPC